jgi:hypothetical protein
MGRRGVGKMARVLRAVRVVKMGGGVKYLSQLLLS